MNISSLPRPEYPRPQFARPDWLCLNGEWQFEIDAGDSGIHRGLIDRDLSGRITVPFCPESELSGIGIPLEAQPHIFGEFYRADNAKALTRQGTGLGLAICKQIVEQAGGQIGFQSTPSQGTSFTFRLPTQASADGGAHESATQRTAAD